MTNVLEYLENTVREVPEKTAFSNGTYQISFSQLHQRARSVGSFLAKEGFSREPVVVYMQKHPDMVNAFFGVLYSGCFYVPIDEEMPAHRIELIFRSLKPRAVICDEVSAKHLKELGTDAKCMLFSQIKDTPEDASLLQSIRAKSLDIDPIYIVFTSGSTGVPKGVAACHRSVIDYIETLSEVMEFSRDTIFGNQTPLYFDACLKELYPTLKFGATTYLIPKELFMFPVKLVEFLNDYKINTICWVVSALTIVSGFGTFSTIKPEYLTNIAFGSEVFQIKQFNIWRSTLPNARFTNLYGPTEATGMSCWYRVDREFAPGETIPIGRPFKNTEILLIKEDGTPAAPGETGEIYIRGTSVTLGYYNDPEKTAECFVQNPLNSAYPETVYRTGDLASLNERGELVFHSRKDYQIKRMGHRIELGEIEAVASLSEQVGSVCCVYDDAKGRLGLYYTGERDSRELAAELKAKLPRYMMPQAFTKLDQMPFTPNGKIDRKSLKQSFMEGK